MASYGILPRSTFDPHKNNCLLLSSRRSLLFGVLILAVANICFSAKAVIIKLMYRYEVSTQSVIALRMLFSLPVYVAVAWYLHRRTNNVQLTRNEWMAISGLGILSYYVSSMLDFWGLKYVTAGVERLILYTYPTIVLLLSAVLFKKTVTRVQYAALLLTYAGVVLAFVAEKGLGDQRNLLLGGALIFACAITYSFYVVYTGEYVHKVGSAKFTCYAVMAATVPALIQSYLHDGMDLFHFPRQVYILSGWISMVSTVLPTFLVVEGIRIVGANNSGIIGLIGPVATIVLGYVFLGEPITPLQVLGTGVVLVGVLKVLSPKS